MGLLQYKAKSQKPYVVECVKQILVSAASVCINRIVAESYCSKLIFWLTCSSLLSYLPV